MSTRILHKPRTGFFRPGIPRLDRDHPIMAGIFDCVIFGQGGIPLNLAVPSIPVTMTSSPTFAQTARGLAGNATAGSSFDVPDHATGVVSKGNFAARLIFLPVTWPANFTAFMDKGTVNRELSFFSDTSGNLDFYGIGTTSGALSTPTGMTAGSVWDFVVSRAGSTATFSVNGVAKGTVTNSAVTRNAASISLGRNTSTGGVNANARYLLFQTWSRNLLPGEIADLAADPFAGLAWPEDDALDFLVGTAAPPPPTDTGEPYHPTPFGSFHNFGRMGSS